ncbi:hypothetical protein GPZ77_34295 (plasmid) [Streptomyces sp. QHH-9511]|uniref:hypothetical protein n=1 Tax=Streptomyces sp. QHH-9511 TaxID=2684468 RepID=UPI001316B316|nr:hypothetical protein [Streptomyces sp. QHH-9511]QGZ53303.1 hypothetical protein GPZ77_34295 [Streptomyces sp. QHH-9511]
MTDQTPVELVALAADMLLCSQPSPRDRALAELLNYAANTWEQQHGFLRDHLIAVARHTRDAARQAAGQTAAEQPDPTTADDPVPLRWGLNDVLYGDDDTTTICLSGPDREPYWLELDPDQAAVLRDDLAGQTAAADDTAQCWRSEPHAPHTWTLSPEEGGVDCPGRPAVEQPAEAQPAEASSSEITQSTRWVIEAQNPSGRWFELSHGFQNADEAHAWKSTELSQCVMPLRVVRVDASETRTVEHTPIEGPR